METTESADPVRFDIDDTEAPRYRLTVAFRLILVIPILAVIAATGAAGSVRSRLPSARPPDARPDGTTPRHRSVRDVRRVVLP